MSRETKIKDVKIMRSGLDNYEIEHQYLAQIGTESCIPKNREAIAIYVDEPCLEACQKLYDLNIETYTSGGHVDGKENATGEAFIGIIYDTLSEENKHIVEQLIKEGIIEDIRDNRGRNNSYTISIKVPIHSDSLVGDISDKLLEIVNYFKQQDVLYGRTTYEELKSFYFQLQEDGTYLDMITFSKIEESEIAQKLAEYLKEGYIPMITEDGKEYFASEDLLNKHKDYIQSLNTSRKI